MNNTQDKAFVKDTKRGNRRPRLGAKAWRRQEGKAVNPGVTNVHTE